MEESLPSLIVFPPGNSQLVPLLFCVPTHVVLGRDRREGQALSSANVDPLGMLVGELGEAAMPAAAS